MCYLRVRNYAEYDESWHHEDTPVRARTRLTWTVPVSIVALAASLEAYSNLEASTHFLKLAHRFGSGSLSRLPYEVLIMIMDEVQQIETQRVQPKWDKAFRCFEGKCDHRDHSNFRPYGPRVEKKWRQLFAKPHSMDLFGEVLDPEEYTEDEKSEMLEDWEAEYGSYNGDDWEDKHTASQSKWVKTLCQCRRAHESSSNPGKLSKGSKLSDASALRD
jgi:hypothetical protein